MVFSSPVFLFLFLPAVFIVYTLIKSVERAGNGVANLWLLAASVVFYIWGAPKSFYLLVFLASIVFDYIIAILIWRCRATARRKRACCFFLSIALNLIFLGYYKYANFFVLDVAGVPPSLWQTVILPIGISFFSFHKISYLVDVYSGKVAPKRNLRDFALYLLFFPQLIAGPIVRYHTIADQIDNRTHSIDAVFEGVWRFAIGLGKKVLIANQLGPVADEIFARPAGMLSPTLAWLGILMYALQIYFDFAGYSDMAIGLGRMFGFRLPENFDRPYTSKSITEFWRRWHMTLSLFFRDYLYIPLGGNRYSLQRTLLNLWIVFLLCGLWHGAKWTFVIWGAYYGLWLTLERLFLLRILERAPAFAANAYAFAVILVGWVFFRSPDLSYAFGYIAKMFDIGAMLTPGPQFYDLVIDYHVYPKVATCTAIALLLSFVPDTLFARLAIPESPQPWIKGMAAMSLVFYSAINLSTGTFNPFLYFQF